MPTQMNKTNLKIIDLVKMDVSGFVSAEENNSS